MNKRQGRARNIKLQNANIYIYIYKHFRRGRKKDNVGFKILLDSLATCCEGSENEAD